MIDAKDQFWQLNPISTASDEDRAGFFDAIAEETSSHQGFFGGGGKYYESQLFKVALLMQDKTFATQFGVAPSVSSLMDCDVDICLDRFFVAGMPGREFDLQIVVGARHLFGKSMDFEVGHSLAVKGLVKDYVNVLNEPVFQKLKIGTSLGLHIGVIFVSDRTTEKILACLQSDAVKKGIRLTGHFNPVFGASLSYIRGVTAALVSGRRNASIINCKIGLDSNASPIDPPLVEGTYLFVQVPTDRLETFNFKNIYWDDSRGGVLENNSPLDCNHLLIRIKRSEPKP